MLFLQGYTCIIRFQDSFNIFVMTSLPSTTSCLNRPIQVETTKLCHTLGYTSKTYNSRITTNVTRLWCEACCHNCVPPLGMHVIQIQQPSPHPVPNVSPPVQSKCTKNNVHQIILTNTMPRSIGIDRHRLVGFSVGPRKLHHETATPSPMCGKYRASLSFSHPHRSCTQRRRYP